MIKSVNIVKFETGKVLLYPLRTIKDSGSFAIPPFVVLQDITYIKLAAKLKETLEFSDIGISPPRDKETLFHKDNIKVTGIKNLKMLHNGSLHVGVFTKDGNYNISSSKNKGSRKGFLYTKDRLVIPLSSSVKELASALEEAFKRSS